MHTPVSEIHEKALLRRLQAGEVTAFEDLYNYYKTPIARNLLRLLRDDDLAQDALQELFTRIWQNRHKIDPERSFRAYLYRVAQHLVVDYYRKAAANERLQENMLRDQQLDYSPEDTFMDKEQLELLHRIIEQLPAERRRVFEMHKLEGLSYNQIAETLNLKSSVISKHIYHANRFIKDYLGRNPKILLALLFLDI